MQTVLAFTGVFVNFVYLFVFHIVYQENKPDHFLHIPADIGVYFILLLSVVFVVGIFLYMKPPKEDAQQGQLTILPLKILLPE
jgi:Co/Zn/Cd efflux system component